MSAICNIIKISLPLVAGLVGSRVRQNFVSAGWFGIGTYTSLLLSPYGILCHSPPPGGSTYSISLYFLKHTQRALPLSATIDKTRRARAKSDGGGMAAATRVSRAHCWRRDRRENDSACGKRRRRRKTFPLSILVTSGLARYILLAFNISLPRYVHLVYSTTTSPYDRHGVVFLLRLPSPINDARASQHFTRAR